MSKKFEDISGEKRILRIKKTKKTKNLLDTIEYCIDNELKLDFLYKGEDNDVLEGYRSVSPVAVGRHKDTGNKVMRAFLNEGVSKSKKTPKFRLFRLDRIQDFNVYYCKWCNRISPVNLEHSSLCLKNPEILKLLSKFDNPVNNK